MPIADLISFMASLEDVVSVALIVFVVAAAGFGLLGLLERVITGRGRWW